MPSRTASVLSWCLVFVGCSDGSDQLVFDAGGAGQTSSGNPGSSGTGTGSGTSSGGVGGSSGGGGSTGSSGSVGTSTSGGSSGNGSGGATSGSSSGSSGGGPAPDPYSGSFKILVLSKTLGFHHDSIPACQQMLRELGRCVDATSCAKTNDTFISDR